MKMRKYQKKKSEKYKNLDIYKKLKIIYKKSLQK